MKKQKSKPKKNTKINKLKSLPNKPILMGNNRFIGNSTT